MMIEEFFRFIRGFAYRQVVGGYFILGSTVYNIHASQHDTGDYDPYDIRFLYERDIEASLGGWFNNDGISEAGDVDISVFRFIVYDTGFIMY